MNIISFLLTRCKYLENERPLPLSQCQPLIVTNGDVLNPPCEMNQALICWSLKHSLDNLDITETS